MSEGTWVRQADELWKLGDSQGAIQEVLRSINSEWKDKPLLTPALQLVFYLYSIQDFAAAENFLRELLKHYPDNRQVLENLAAVLTLQNKNSAEAQQILWNVVGLHPDSYNAWDILAHSLGEDGNSEKAKEAGERALDLKDQQCSPPADQWKLPVETPQEFDSLHRGKKDLIAFSLWGKGRQFLRGALRNQLMVHDIYRGWRCRFYVDDTVPGAMCALLADLGAELVFEEPGQSIRQRLTWRFQVANDPDVRRFIVRDCDAVISAREAVAVNEWLRSDCWFHAMRDWWSHTDLMLAGMWGGRAGILPDLKRRMMGFSPGATETKHVDQWFLREEVWPLVRESCLVHDRFYRCLGSHPWPIENPPGKRHVGQNETAISLDLQESILRPWLDCYDFLR